MLLQVRGSIWLGAVLALMGMLAVPLTARAQKTETATVTVFAAASLKNALDEAAAAYTAASGNMVSASYAASSALAKQIEQAAPADIFISADLEWMDDLDRKGLVAKTTRHNLLGNTLVLVAPASSTLALKIEPGFGLAGALGEGRLAVGDVKSVPAGRYAKASLEALGVWASVEGKLAPAENVRAALALVAQGEAPLGIVYKTDAAPEPKVKVIGEFPESSHAPIIYPIAMTARAEQSAAARSLLAFLRAPEAAAIFTKHGFQVLK